MTDYQKYINALRKCAKEHENDRTSMGHVIVSDLCRDTANLLEEIEQEPCEDATLKDIFCMGCEYKEQEPKTGHWIPVSEELPQKNVEVLATTKWGEVTIAEMYSANDWFIHEGATNAKTDGIVAWMPLPKPYMEVEE